MDAIDFLKEQREELGHLVGSEIYDVDQDGDGQIYLTVRDFQDGEYTERTISFSKESFEVSDPEPVIEPHWKHHR